MSKRLVVSYLLNRVYFGNINKDGLMENDKVDVTRDFKACVLEFLKNCDDNAFKEKVLELVK